MTNSRSTPPRRDLAWLLVLGGLLCGLYLAGELFVVEELGFPLDDSWIHLQFAKQLGAGHGMSYQGERQVAGSTAPLWTALLAPFAWSPLWAPVWSKLLGVACYLASLVLVGRVATELGLSRTLSRLAVVLVAMTDWMVWSALSGMEIPLFVLLSLLGMEAHLVDRRRQERSTRRFPWSTLWFSLACLARPEALLLLVLSWLDGSLSWRSSDEELEVRPCTEFLRRLPSHLAVAAVILLPVGGYFYAIGGSPLPTTLSVKTGTDRVLIPGGTHLWEMVHVLSQSLLLPGLLAGVGVAAALRTIRIGLLPILWLLGLPMAYSVLAGTERLNLGNFGRYLFPLLPLVALFGCLGLQTVLRSLPDRLFGGRFRTELWAALIVALPTALVYVTGVERYVTSVANVTDSDVAMARWVRDELPREAHLGVQDIGAMGYFAPQPLLDMVGIVDPEIQPYLRGDKMGSHPTGLQGWADYVRAANVDFIVLFPEAYGGIDAIRQVMPGLVPLHRIRLERNTTMAADEVVVYATPWGRAASAGPQAGRSSAPEGAPAGPPE